MSTRRRTPNPIERLFTYQLHVLKKQTDRTMNDAFRSRIGLTLTEARLLLCAGAFGAMSVSELGKASNLDRSQASRATDILEARGLLIKRSSASDGRGVEVVLTAEGTALYKRGLVISRESNTGILAALSKEERKVFVDAFDKLVTAASASTEVSAEEE